jgi:hypothetical protein
MPETIAQAPTELTFEETAYSQAPQILADPITDSTRRRQSLLLLLSVLSLAIFFGILVPEKASFGGFELKIDTPSTPQGTPSTKPATIAKNARAFSKLVLCPVLVYSVLAFWLSVYRDDRAAKYLRVLGAFAILRAAAREYGAAMAKIKERLASIERYRSLTIAKPERENALFQSKLDEIASEFAKKFGPIQEEHAATFAEFNKLRKENALISPELANKLLRLGAEMEALDKKQDEDFKALREAFPVPTQDPALAEAGKRSDELSDESFRITRKLLANREIVNDLNATVERWRRLWLVLEVGFPSILGLAAIVVPFLKFR